MGPSQDGFGLISDWIVYGSAVKFVSMNYNDTSTLRIDLRHLMRAKDWFRQMPYFSCAEPN